MDELKMTLQNMSKLFTAQMARYEAGKEVSDLPADYADFKTFVLTALDSLHQQIELLAREVDHQEMRSRRKMLLLHGIQEADDKDPASDVLNVCVTSLGLADCTRADISRAHRMGRVTNGKPRPLLVKFSSMEVRSKVWAAKTGLKGSGLTISEFLTKKRHDVFIAARAKFGVTKSWTRDGIVMVLSDDGRKHRITTMKELESIPSPKTSPPTNNDSSKSSGQVSTGSGEGSRAAAKPAPTSTANSAPKPETAKPARAMRSVRK